MALTLASAARLLSEYGLLREIIQGDDWTLDAQAVNGFDKPFGSITYDTRQVVSNTLLCCKGRFKAEYLDGIDDRGLAAYVAENDFSAATKAPGLIVNDARKAMSLLSAAFYGYPQDQLKVVGITGTKGKTTAAYLTQAMLNGCSGGKCALFSSVDNCLDGHTYAESDLTTPESMDAFRMMREAADNGMEYLVMEVSSQAYKVDRVFGLTFDVAAFLNISPDHISPIEHPTFEDYFHCKRQIVKNCRSLVLGTACAHADLIRQDAAIADIPITAFALGEASAADVTAWPESADHSRFAIAVEGEQIGSLSLQLDGDFNYANAAASIAFADDKDDMEAVGILAIDYYGRFHCFRTVENDPRIQIGIGDTAEHVLADVFHRLVIRVFEGENQMVQRPRQAYSLRRRRPYCETYFWTCLTFSNSQPSSSNHQP